jgi:hypothetical protein
MGLPLATWSITPVLAANPTGPSGRTQRSASLLVPPGGTLLASTDSLTARASGLALSGLSSGLVYVRTRGSMGVYAAG